MSQSIQAEALTLKDLSVILSRSPASLHRDLAAGRLPSGFRIGTSRRWLRSEIERWLQSGCPSRSEWEEMERLRKSKKV